MRFVRRVCLGLLVVVPGTRWLEGPRGGTLVNSRMVETKLQSASPAPVGEGPRTSSSHAFAALVWGKKTDAFVDLLVLVRSLRKGGAKSDVLALFPERSDELFWGEVLKQHGILSRVVPQIPLPKSMLTESTSRKWANVFSKFVIYLLTEYETIALLDTDMLCAPEINADAVFSECSEADLCMGEDPNPFGFQEDYEDKSLITQRNAGLMVVRPSVERFSHLLRAIQQETHHYHLPEQQFISHYVARRENNMSFQLLDSRWNHFRLWHDRAWIHHFMGGTPDDKPGKFKLFHGPGYAESLPESFRQWQQIVFEVIPCTRVKSESQCSARGNQCHWCNSYCMEVKMPCSNTLFASSIRHDRLGVVLGNPYALVDDPYATLNPYAMVVPPPTLPARGSTIASASTAFGNLGATTLVV